MSPHRGYGVRRLGFAGAVAIVAACTSTNTAAVTPHGERPAKDVVEVRTQPAPEGPAAVTVRSADAGWSDVRAALPSRIPPPLAQHGCTLGNVTTLVFRDGTSVDYGPCRRPGAIEAIRAAITTAQHTEAELRVALDAWASFPVSDAIRPIVMADDPVAAPALGFASTDLKEAFLTGLFVAPRTLPSGPAESGGYPTISAADALSVMRAEGSPALGAQQSPAPLTISAVHFEVAPFTTDRGPQSLPAWLFSFRGVTNPAAVLAVAPGARFAAPPGSLHGPTGTARLSPDGRSATINFTGASAGTGPCTANYTVDQLASSEAVAVKVVEHRPEPGPGTTGVACLALGYPRTVVVRFASPLGARVLVDATTTGPLAVAPS